MLIPFVLFQAEIFSLRFLLFGGPMFFPLLGLLTCFEE
jgi:hypothetical protein